MIKTDCVKIKPKLAICHLSEDQVWLSVWNSVRREILRTAGGVIVPQFGATWYSMGKL